MHPRWSLDGKFAYFDLYSKKVGKQLYMISIRSAVIVAHKMLKEKERVQVIIGGRVHENLHTFFSKYRDSKSWNLIYVVPLNYHISLGLDYIEQNGWKNVKFYQCNTCFDTSHRKVSTFVQEQSYVTMQQTLGTFFSVLHDLNIEDFLRHHVDKKSYTSLLLDFVGVENVISKSFTKEEVLDGIDKISVRQGESGKRVLLSL